MKSRVLQVMPGLKHSEQGSQDGSELEWRPEISKGQKYRLQRNTYQWDDNRTGGCPVDGPCQRMPETQHLGPQRVEEGMK